MLPALLLACSTPFPCAQDELLDADGGCVPGSKNTGAEDDTGLDTSDDTGEPPDTDDTAPQDADGDGSTADEDCDDGDPQTFPGAVEARDGRDQDCDGYVDEDVPDLLFDLADPRHGVWGLGANIWPDADAWVAPLDTLHGRLVRANLGPVWDTTGVDVPLGGGASDYNAYVASAMATTSFGSLDDALTTSAEIDRLDTTRLERLHSSTANLSSWRRRNQTPIMAITGPTTMQYSISEGPGTVPSIAVARIASMYGVTGLP
jgi:hypothetical protein